MYVKPYFTAEWQQFVTGVVHQAFVKLGGVRVWRRVPRDQYFNDHVINAAIEPAAIVG